MPLFSPILFVYAHTHYTIENTRFRVYDYDLASFPCSLSSAHNTRMAFDPRAEKRRESLVDLARDDVT